MPINIASQLNETIATINSIKTNKFDYITVNHSQLQEIIRRGNI